MALVSDFGIVNDFTIDGSKNETFPKLPKKICPFLFARYKYPYFGVYSNNSIFFLSCSPNTLVTEYKINEDNHGTIPKSL